jgi:hypothetical protein
MPATMETISIKLDYVITVADLTADRVAKLEDDWIRAEKTMEGLRGLALRLSAASMALAASRAVAAIAAPTRTVLALAGGAFAGGFLGTIAWQILHAHSALASVLP